MGNSNGVDIDVSYISGNYNRDSDEVSKKIEGSDLYNYLLAIPGNTPDRIIIPLRPPKPFNSEVKIWFANGIYYNIFYSNMLYRDNNLVISLNPNRAYLFSEYDITYDLDINIGTTLENTDIVYVQTMIERFIEKEIAANQILSNYSELKYTEIYQRCKYLLIEGIKPTGYIRFGKQDDIAKVIYGYHKESIEIEVPDLPEYSHLNIHSCSVDTCGYVLLTEQETKNIKSKNPHDGLDLGYGYHEPNIVEAILSKVRNREYNIPGLLKNVAIVHTKRAGDI